MREREKERERRKRKESSAKKTKKRKREKKVEEEVARGMIGKGDFRDEIHRLFSRLLFFPLAARKAAASLQVLSLDKDTSLYAARAKPSPRRASNAATTSFQEKESSFLLLLPLLLRAPYKRVLRTRHFVRRTEA